MSFRLKFIQISDSTRDSNPYISILQVYYYYYAILLYYIVNKKITFELLFSVLGALIGKQKGRNIEIMNSFELVFHEIEGEPVIDKDYYNTKEEQCKIIIIIKDLY